METIKKAVPILGIISIVLIVLLIVGLTFIDSTLMLTTLKGCFVAFCVLLPLNAAIKQ